MPTLREKFHGCIAASWVGSAMGAAVEGWTSQRIRETHGRLERLLPYGRHPEQPDQPRPAGTTEDGIERQKLIATAIIEKPGRIRAADLVRVWLRDLDREKMVQKQEPFDRSLRDLAAAEVPPCELGRFWPYPNIVSVARASHPLGLINAGDPDAAAVDSIEVGKVYSPETAPALRWAALYNAAIAEACRPEASVDSVLDVARRFVTFNADADRLHARYDTIARDVKRALGWAQDASEPDELLARFEEVYTGGRYFTYALSQASEVVSKGLAVFALCQGEPREAIVTAVNCGRDTDCLAAVAGGLAGALRGADAVPAEWIEQVNEATRQDPATNNHRSIEETADGLLEAFRSRRKALQERLAVFDDADLK